MKILYVLNCFEVDVKCMCCESFVYIFGLLVNKLICLVYFEKINYNLIVVVIKKYFFYLYKLLVLWKVGWKVRVVCLKEDF